MSDAYPMDLITRLRDEAGLCRIETATDIAALLEEAADDLERQEQSLTASEKRIAELEAKVQDKRDDYEAGWYARIESEGRFG